MSIRWMPITTVTHAKISSIPEHSRKRLMPRLVAASERESRLGSSSISQAPSSGSTGDVHHRGWPVSSGFGSYSPAHMSTSSGTAFTPDDMATPAGLRSPSNPLSPADDPCSPENLGTTPEPTIAPVAAATPAVPQSSPDSTSEPPADGTPPVPVQVAATGISSSP